MEIKRTTEIFVEANRRFVVKTENPRQTCSICGEPIIAAEFAAALLNLKCRAVYRLVESGAIHFTDTATGATLVCPASVSAILDRKSKPQSDENC
jgi:hypothetical protein